MSPGRRKTDNRTEIKKTMGNIFQKTGIGIVPFLLLLVLIFSKISLSYYTFGVDVEFTRWFYVISAVVAGLCIFFACRNYNFFKLYASILLSLFALSSLVDLGYSPIDEAAHFEYAVHLFNTWTLPVLGEQYLWDASAVNSVNFCETNPGTINHEAMQGPVYYIFLALFGSAIKDSTACFIAFRIIGLLLVACTAVGLNKLTRSLFGLSVSQSQVCRLLMLLTILSPGYLYRAARLNNEIMVCFLFAVLLYQFFLSFKDNRTYRYWLVSLLSVLLFLTKSTAIYCMIFPVLLILFHLRDSRKITVVISLTLSGLIALPWFKFNLETYHALTGANKHFEFVTEVLQVNPYHVGVDFFEAFFNFLPLTFYSGTEVTLHPVTAHLVVFLYILLLVIFGILVYRTALSIFNVRSVLNNRFSYDNHVNMLIVMVSFAVILLVFYSLKYITGDFTYRSNLTIVTLSICFISSIVLSILIYRKSIAISRNYEISIRTFVHFTKKDLHFVINVSCISVILIAVIVLVCGSIVSTILAVRGRYLYPVIPAFSVLALNNIDSIKSKLTKKTLKASALVMLAFVSVDVFSGMIFKAMKYQNWQSDGAVGFVVSDVTDNNWKNGVFFDGRKILLDYSPRIDYSLLKGRVFVCNGEYAWIERDERVGKYEYLYLKNKVDPQKITGITWKNVDNYSLKRYNFYGDQFPLGKINGSTLSQSFEVKSADSLLGFSVIMATYGQPPLTVNVDYKIVDSNYGSVVAKGQRVLEGVNDNQWVDILFQKPVSVKKDGKYRIEFTLNNSEDKMLTVYAIRNNVYKGGELTADIPGLEKDIDLSFGLIQN